MTEAGATACISLHTAYIADRGGVRRVARLFDISKIEWHRLRDDISTAQVIISGDACTAQADILNAVEPHRSELIIYRGDERVWEGPVNKVGWHADFVEIIAKDVMDYVFFRPLTKTWDNSYAGAGPVPVTQRIKQIMQYEMTQPYTYYGGLDGTQFLGAPAWEQMDPPANVLPHLVTHSFPNEVSTSATTVPFQMTVGEHIDNFARTGGIDYTTVGRAIHVWDTSRAIGQIRTMTDADFYGPVIVSAYGSDHAKLAFTSATDGRYGGAGGELIAPLFLAKKGPAGTQLALPPPGSVPRSPSIVDAGTRAWNEYRYWMAYRRGTPATMRIAASNDGSKWADIAYADVDADSESGVTVTPGVSPFLTFGYDNRLWLFYVGTDNILYATRSSDGKNFTSKIETMDAPVGVSFTNPNAFYDKVTERWTLFVVNAANGDLLWTTSKAKELDGTDDWNALRKVTIDGYPDIQSADLRRLNGGWVGIILAPGGLHVIQSKGILPSQGFSAATGQAIPTVAAGKHDAIGRPTWLPLSDGSMDVWYQASLAGVPHVFRTKLTGPFPPLDYKDYYGPWAKIFTVYDENQDNAPSQVELNSQAQRNLTGRNPVPIEVRIPDNSSVRMDRGIGIDELVPGVQINLLATMNLRKISQLQKLHSVTVTETAEDGENVQITLVPATRPDSDVEEDS